MDRLIYKSLALSDLNQFGTTESVSPCSKELFEQVYLNDKCLHIMIDVYAYHFQVADFGRFEKRVRCFL